MLFLNREIGEAAFASAGKTAQWIQLLLQEGRVVVRVKMQVLTARRVAGPALLPSLFPSGSQIKQKTFFQLRATWSKWGILHPVPDPWPPGASFPSEVLLGRNVRLARLKLGGGGGGYEDGLQTLILAEKEVNQVAAV